MKFAVALCVTILATCYQSANADGPTSPHRISPGRVRNSPSSNHISKVRSARFNSPTPGSQRITSETKLAGAQLQRSNSRSPPAAAQSTFLPADEEAISLPIQAIKNLGKYNKDDIMKAQDRFDGMDSASLETNLVHTKLFADLVRRAKKSFAKYPQWTHDQRKDYIRRKVAGQLILMEKTYGRDFAEKILIRAMLDKGY